MNSILCPICGANRLSLRGDIQGYSRSSIYGIIECQECKVSFSDPLETDRRIYEAIYQRVKDVPGYHRYAELADDVLKSQQPLQFIKMKEDCYYGVVDYIQKNVKGTSELIIEIGCGQGYLTYSLNQAGYRAIGLDLSSEVIAIAESKYGSYYYNLSLEDFVQTHGVRPNHVICTELIEHLVKPVEFVKSVLDLLADGGSLIFSTPNKKPNDQSVWNSESPPVHLWWFTYESLNAMAHVLDVQFMHIPLNGFYSGKRIKLLPDGYKANDRAPVFDENFNLINPVKKKNAFRLLLRRWEKGLVAALRNFLKIKNDIEKSSLEISFFDSRIFSESLCGVYKKK